MAGSRAPKSSRRTRRLPTADRAPHSIPLSQKDTDEESERGPYRRCIVTRAKHERGRMLRFVLGPDRAVVPDLGARLPGRGMWLSARADVIEAARAKNAFARVSRGPVILPADLMGVLQAGLARRIVDHLGLARRAGQAVCGFARAREWLQAGSVGLVVQASDGSEDERRRLLSGARDVAVGWPLGGAQLGAIFARDHAVHVAVASGRLAEALVNEIERFSGVSGKAFLTRPGFGQQAGE